MKLRMDYLVKAFSTGLDLVEGELLGASVNHGKRIAALCCAMGKRLGLSENEISALSAAGMLHDNALTEYIFSEHAAAALSGVWGAELRTHQPFLKDHCVAGQRNIGKLRFSADVGEVILYHHERADGMGPLGKREGEYPLGAELVAIADSVDVDRHLQRVSSGDLFALRKEIAAAAGESHTRRAAEAMLAVLDESMLYALRDENIAETLEQTLPPWRADMEDDEFVNVADFVSRIIDYKSAFTRRHSSGIADKAWFLAGHFGFEKEAKMEFFLAAALHDIGKLATPKEILEKPGKLDDREFQIIKEHARHTWNMLKDIGGFERVCAWASSHHEKLDGSGYPFGKKAECLDFMSRLLACIDIYQAVSEERPYHPARSHEETMPILYDMAAKGYIDKDIAARMDKALADRAGNNAR